MATTTAPTATVRKTWTNIFNEGRMDEILKRNRGFEEGRLPSQLMWLSNACSKLYDVILEQDATIAELKARIDTLTVAVEGPRRAEPGPVKR